jgi:murein L,D-transpeptidase YafK
MSHSKTRGNGLNVLRAGGLLGLAFLFFLGSEAHASPGSKGGSGLSSKSVVLVEKKTNTLRLVSYEDGVYRPIKEFHATLGQVKGDKEDEGDLKTPEGIYVFKALVKPPQLAPKFGAMAFYLNFPNTFDSMAGRTGSNIMLHATNEPERLKNNYDSQGCVVVENKEISEISSYIRLGLTPILIFSDAVDLSGVNNEYLSPGRDTRLKDFFRSWIRDWEGKELSGYIDHYHSDFSAQGMNKENWKKFKSALNERYSMIQVNPSDVRYYRHPKYSMITFTQSYVSKLRGGGWGHRSRGTKILYIAEEGAKPKIIAETFSNLVW